MDQAKHAMLVATATSQVASWLMSKVDFSAELKLSRADTEAIGAKLGLSPSEALRGHDDVFEMIVKGKVVTHCEQKAAEEVAAAVREAVQEADQHKVRLAGVQNEHDIMINDINKSLSASVPEDEDIADNIRSSKAELLNITQKFYDDLIKLIQERHRLELRHCFTGHLVPESTADQLLDLYEVK